MSIDLPFTRSHAFIIGINDYVHITPLKTAVNDAKGIAQRLQTQHGYEVHGPLLNPTKDELETLFFETMPNEVGEDDRLVFYFAGHGIALDGEDGPNGYIVPADAKQGDRESLVPMNDLHICLKNLPCKHGLLILDCCFSGAFKWSTGFRDVIFDLPKVIYDERFQRYVEDEAWQVITSSAYDQKAVDVISHQSIGMRAEGKGMHSPFAEALFEALEGKADIVPIEREDGMQGDGIITASELFAYLREKVESETIEHAKRQSPSMFNLARHEKGEFIFLHPTHRYTLPKRPVNNPFMGLASYNEADSVYFFGRDRVIEALLPKVQKHQLTVVSGASGTGKSSVIKAGLLPKLRKEGWQLLAVVRPGKHPVQELKDKLGDMTSSLSNNPKNILIVDQYEELITQCEDEQERKDFEKQLASYLRSYPDLRIILSVRSDFEGQFESEALKEWWAEGRYIVPAFSLEEYREVITRPAIQAVLFYEPHDQLVSKLEEEVSQAPGALPLLSFTLSELYHALIKSGREDRALKLEDYQQMGGLTGALRKKADEVYEAEDMDALRKQSMKRLMLRMVSLEGGELARRRVLMEELVYSDPEETQRIQELAEKLAQARLIRKGRDEQGNEFVEPAHDALVRAWSRLWEWIKEVRVDKITVLDGLSQAAVEYQEVRKREDEREKKSWNPHKTSNGYLWYDKPLLELAVPIWQRPIHHLNAAEEIFVERSKNRKRILRNRRITWVSIAFAFVLGLASVAYWQKGIADQRAIESNANELAAEARQIGLSDPALALNLAYAAYQTNPSEKPAAALTDIWNLKSMAYLQKFSHDGWVRTIAFSSDGSKMVTGANDDMAILWDMKTGEELQRFSHYNSVTAVAISPDEKQLITGTGGGSGYLTIWDLKSGKKVGESWENGGRIAVFEIAYLPDLNQILTVSRKGVIKRWDLETQEELSRNDSSFLAGLYYDAIAFSPDLSHMLTSEYGEISLWNVSTASRLRKFGKINDQQNITALTFSPDGSQILTGSEDKNIILWSGDGRKELRRFDSHSSILYALAFSQDGKQIVVGTENEARIIDLGLRPEIRGFGAENLFVSSVAFSPDGKWALAASDARDAHIWEVETGNPLYQLRGGKEMNSVAFSPDGVHVLIGYENGKLEWWEAKTESIKQAFVHPNKDYIYAVAISPNGGFAIVGSHAGNEDKQQNLLAWNLQSESLDTLPIQFNGYAGDVNAVAVSPDGKFVLSGSEDSTAILWNFQSKDSLREFRGHTDAVYAVAFSPDGSTVATGSDDKTAKIWDVQTGELLSTFREHTARITSIAYSPDGKLILTGSEDQSAKLWEAETGAVIRTFIGHKAEVYSVAFSPDGRRVLTGSTMPSNGGQQNVKLWDATLDWDDRIYKLDSLERAEYGIRVKY